MNSKILMALMCAWVSYGVSAGDASAVLPVQLTPWDNAAEKYENIASLRKNLKSNKVPNDMIQQTVDQTKGFDTLGYLNASEFEAAKKKVNQAQGVEVFGHVVNIGGLVTQIAVDKNASLEFLNRFERFKNSKTFQGLRTNKKHRLERAALSFAQSLAASALMRLGGSWYKNRVKYQFNKTYRGEPGVSAEAGTTTDV
ncbi:MAG: hypothetical protein WCJ17_02230 [bacterium]